MEQAFNCKCLGKETRKVEVSPTDVVYGEFTNASALLITAGINYKF